MVKKGLFPFGLTIFFDFLQIPFIVFFNVRANVHLSFMKSVGGQCLFETVTEDAGVRGSGSGQPEPVTD